MPSRLNYIITSQHGFITGKRAISLINAALTMCSESCPKNWKSMSKCAKMQEGAKLLPKGYKLFIFRIPRHCKLTDTPLKSFFRPTERLFLRNVENIRGLE